MNLWVIEGKRDGVWYPLWSEGWAIGPKCNWVMRKLKRHKTELNEQKIWYDGGYRIAKYTREERS